MSTWIATSNHGLRVATGMVARQRYAAPSTALRQPTVTTGVTFVITDFLHQSRTLNTAAVRLNSLIKTNITNDSAFVDAWDAWFADWSAFYDKYVNSSIWLSGALAQSAVSLDYDNFMAELNRYEAQYNSFQADYDNRAKALGAPLAGPLPSPTSPPSGGLPWWFWVGGTALVAAGGYLLYKSYQNAQKGGEYLLKHPELLAL